MAKSPDYLKYQEFNQTTATSSGGVTGSKQIKTNDIPPITYQLKPSIKDNSLMRRIKAGGLDAENFGEVIASYVGRALTNSNQEPELVPEVKLVYDTERKRVAVASRYLENVKGDLDGYTKKEQGAENIKGHVLVQFNEPQQSPNNRLILDLSKNQQAKEDLANNIALSALLGDHDVNPANMLAINDNNDSDRQQIRIARIDFGHAFNDLLTGPKLFGGGMNNNNNRILDFINRETVSHLLPAKRKAKLWRDYQGLIPSHEFAAALEKFSAAETTEKITAGIENAKKAFLDLAQDPELQKDQKVITHISKSLAAISNRIGYKIDPQLQPIEAINQTFNNLQEFTEKGRQQMQEIARLARLQADIDQAIKKGTNLDQFKQQYEELKNTAGIGLQDKGIQWLKTNAKSKAFKGNFEEYIQNRSKQLGVSEQKQHEISGVSAIESKEDKKSWFSSIWSGLSQASKIVWQSIKDTAKYIYEEVLKPVGRALKNLSIERNIPEPKQIIQTINITPSKQKSKQATKNQVLDEKTISQVAEAGKELGGKITHTTISQQEARFSTKLASEKQHEKTRDFGNTRA